MKWLSALYLPEELQLHRSGQELFGSKFSAAAGRVNTILPVMRSKNRIDRFLKLEQYEYKSSTSIYTN